MKRTTLLCLVLSLIATNAGAAEADVDPNRAIRIIDVFVPGGPSDIISRLLAQKMTESLGQPVIVENRGSAGGIVGFEVGSKAHRTATHWSSHRRPQSPSTRASIASCPMTRCAISSQ